MHPKSSLLRHVRTAGIFLAAGFLVLLVFLSQRGDYRLNRTVRECHLRLYQIEILSATMSRDFRMVFHEDRCIIDLRNNGDGDWSRYWESAYARRVRNISGTTELIFSRGTLAEYRRPGRTSPIQKYITVDFAHPGSTRTPGLIFFASGMWHVRR
jgi:hypothetical protein